MKSTSLSVFASLEMLSEQEALNRLLRYKRRHSSVHSIGVLIEIDTLLDLCPGHLVDISFPFSPMQAVWFSCQVLKPLHAM